jgi:hypothetical protein
VGGLVIWLAWNKANASKETASLAAPAVPAPAPALTHEDSIAIARALAPKAPTRPKADTTAKKATSAERAVAASTIPAKVAALPTGVTPMMDSVARVGLLLAAERPTERSPIEDSRGLSREAFAERQANMGTARPLLFLVHATPGRPDLDSAGVSTATFFKRVLNPAGTPRFTLIENTAIRQEVLTDTSSAASFARAANAELVVTITPSIRRDSSLQFLVLAHDPGANEQYDTRTMQGRWRADSAIFGMTSLAANLRRQLDQMDRAPRKGAVDPVKRAFDERAANMGPPRRVVVANHPPDRNPALQEAGTQVMDVLRHSLSLTKRFVPVRRDSTHSALERSRELATMRSLLNADLILSIRGIPTQGDSLMWLVSISDATAARPFDQRSVTSQRVSSANPMTSAASLVALVINALEMIDRSPRALPAPTR